ncbi:MAG: hypothetical protein KA354_23040 [Phycisphaerae bacterium]|nr:hypothetical protein [Phycisphaerae bacterium]
MSATCFRVCVGSVGLAAFAGLAVHEARAADQDLLVTTSNGILRYDGTSGAYLGPFATGFQAEARVRAIRYGPDGQIYVSLNASYGIARVNAKTGKILDDPWASRCDLNGPLGMRFGPDGDLYVASLTNTKVVRFNGTTGACMGDFIPPYYCGLSGSRGVGGIAFGPGNRLYIGTTFSNNGVRLFDAPTGACIGEFISQSLCPSAPSVLGLGPADGYLYVVGYNYGEVWRYDAETGAPIDVFVPPYTTLVGPSSCSTWGPDGCLYVVDYGAARIQRYHGTTGQFMGTFAAGPEMVELWGAVFMPHPADFDTDGDVDVGDVGRFQACVTGPTIPYNPTALPPGCVMPVDANGHIDADFDQDGDVDLADFGVFQRCYSGAGKAADSACTD